MPGPPDPPPPERFARILWAAVLVTIALTPLVLSTATKDVYRLPKTLFFQAAVLLLGAAAVVWDARQGKLGRLAAEHRFPLILAAAAVAWTAIVSMTAQNPVVAVHGPLTMLCYAAFFGVALLFARRTPGLALTALLAPAVINTIVLMLQWRDIWTPVARDSRAGRLAHTALQGNPDPVGVYLMIPAIAAIAAAIAFRRWRPVLAATAALLLIGLLLTESITVFVTLAAVFVAFIVVMPSRKARIAMSAMLVAGVIVLAAYGPTRTRAVRIAKWVSEGRFQEVTSFRLPAWGVAWQMFLDHPLTGVGPGGYGARYMSYKLAGDELHPQWMTMGNYNFGEAHNDHLQLLAEAGLPGFALFAAFLGGLALLSLRPRGSGEEASFVRLFALPAVTGVAVAGLAQFPLHLTAPSAVSVFAAALCFAWSAAVPAAGPAASRRGGILRMALAAALVVVAALAIQRHFLTRYQCSAEKKRTELWLGTARQSGSLERRHSVARGAIPRLMRCAESDPSDFEALFLLGVARMEADQREGALAAFEAALALNERPEIYTNVGLLQLEAGRVDEARQNLLKAAFFSIDYTAQVDRSLADELATEVQKRQERLRAATK